MIIKKYSSLLLLLSLIGQTSAMENDGQSGENRVRSHFLRLFLRDEVALIDQLCKAILYYDLEKAEELLEKKVDPNTQNCMGITPLYLSAAIGDLNACKLLIKYGADPFLPSPAANFEFPLSGALSAPFMYNSLATSIPINKNHDDVAIYFIENCKVDLNAKSASQDTFLNQAALIGNIEIFEILLQKGAHLNVTNMYNSNVLHSAAFPFHGKTEEQSIKCIIELLRCGVDYRAKNKEGKTPAQYATSKLVKKALKDDFSVKQFLISETSLHKKNIYKELNGRAITGKSMRHKEFVFKRTEALLLGNK